MLLVRAVDYHFFTTFWIILFVTTSFLSRLDAVLDASQIPTLLRLFRTLATATRQLPFISWGLGVIFGRVLLFDAFHFWELPSSLLLEMLVLDLGMLLVVSVAHVVGSVLLKRDTHPVYRLPLERFQVLTIVTVVLVDVAFIASIWQVLVDELG